MNIFLWSTEVARAQEMDVRGRRPLLCGIRAEGAPKLKMLQVLGRRESSPEFRRKY